MTPRALLHLLWNGPKAVDACRAALEVGLLELLDAGPITVGEAAEKLGLVPGRLDKLLECLETLGFVVREGEGRYQAPEPLTEAVRAVVGEGSIEADRDRHPWRSIHGRLPEVLRGTHAIPAADFPWPPETPAQVAGFEASMALGCRPIAESFVVSKAVTWRAAHDRPVRLLDVGGGDGTLAERLLDATPNLLADVYNLPEVGPLVARRIAARTDDRLGWRSGDFLAEELPRGHDVLSFVRVLHDWPTQVARLLLAKAHRALPPGGRILICEELRDSERLAAQFFWSYFLIGLDGCASRLRPHGWYLAALTEAGFVEPTLLDAPFPVIAALRP
jgi:demethylspheroidene O-methyltransferase